MANLKVYIHVKKHNQCYIRITQYYKDGSLLAVLGYALLCGEVSVPVRSEHVTTVSGDTLVVGDSVEVMSA